MSVKKKVSEEDLQKQTIDQAKLEMQLACNKYYDLFPKAELKHIDFESGLIPCNGRVLKINTSVSVDKFVPLEVLQRTFAFGKDIAAIEKDISLAWDFLNKMKFAEAAVVMNNLRECIVKHQEEKVPSALELCFLYLTYEDEDERYYNPGLDKQKLADIRKEGYDVNDFFTLACNLCTGYIAAFEKISLTISQELQKMSNILDK